MSSSSSTTRSVRCARPPTARATARSARACAVPIGTPGRVLRVRSPTRRLLVEQVGVDPGVALRQPRAAAAQPRRRARVGTAGTSTDAPSGSSRPRSPAHPHSPAITRPDGALTTFLEEATDVSALVVSAPAGAGKTEALVGWLIAVPVVAWLAATTDSNDPAVFWPAVAKALGLARSTTSAPVTQGSRAGAGAWGAPERRRHRRLPLGDEPGHPCRP